MEITTHIPPLPDSLITELADFWLKAFGEPYEDQAGIRGQELEYNNDFFYVTRREGKVVGTARLIVPREIPTLGGLGEVATDPDSRRLGIGSAMSAKAGEDFKSMGGKAWFLGTINPNAMRVYSRLGWKRLAWSIAWAQIIGDESPEEFLIDYFRTETGESSVRPGSPLERVTMVPLFATPHDWQILDSNTGIFSTRYAMLRGALLLYPRFEKMCKDNKGTWFASYTNNGKLTGISTARLDNAGNCKIDAVAHSRFMSVWPELVQNAIKWASSKSAANCYAMLSQEDEEKQSCFEEIGFYIKGTGPDFQLGDRSVPAVKMVI
jgi:GNAT superfamily N-acetyltransferase